MTNNYKGYFWWNHGKGAPLKVVQLWLFSLNDATHATDWMDIAFNYMLHAKKRWHRLKNQGRRHPTIWNDRDGTPDREANAPSTHQNKTYFFAVARRSDEFGLVSTRRVHMSPAARNDKIAMGVGDIKSTMVTMVTRVDEFNGGGSSHNVRTWIVGGKWIVQTILKQDWCNGFSWGHRQLQHLLGIHTCPEASASNTSPGIVFLQLPTHSIAFHYDCVSAGGSKGKTYSSPSFWFELRNPNQKI